MVKRPIPWIFLPFAVPSRVRTVSRDNPNKGVEKPKSRPKRRGPRPNLVAWMPRREACQLLQSSVTTLRNWEGKRLRVKHARSTDGTTRVFYHRDDVERVRLEKLGPRQWEIERHILDALAGERAPSAIIHELSHVTLADVERIRDHNARLSGACILDPASVRELRQLLDVEVMTGAVLVAHVRALVERVERLAGRLAMRQARHSSEPPPPKSANGE